MSKVTSKLQVTIPKAIAEQYGIQPGDEIDFQPAGPQIRVVPPGRKRGRLSRAERLRLFDEEEARIRERWSELTVRDPVEDRGWTREELYLQDGRVRGTSGDGQSD